MEYTEEYDDEIEDGEDDIDAEKGLYSDGELVDDDDSFDDDIEAVRHVDKMMSKVLGKTEGIPSKRDQMKNINNAKDEALSQRLQGIENALEKIAQALSQAKVDDEPLIKDDDVLTFWK
jgi:hypothetical protein